MCERRDINGHKHEHLYKETWIQNYLWKERYICKCGHISIVYTVKLWKKRPQD